MTFEEASSKIYELRSGSNSFFTRYYLRNWQNLLDELSFIYFNQEERHNLEKRLQKSIDFISENLTSRNCRSELILYYKHLKRFHKVNAYGYIVPLLMLSGMVLSSLFNYHYIAGMVIGALIGLFINSVLGERQRTISTSRYDFW